MRVKIGAKRAPTKGSKSARRVSVPASVGMILPVQASLGLRTVTYRLDPRVTTLSGGDAVPIPARFSRPGFLQFRTPAEGGKRRSLRLTCQAGLKFSATPLMQ